MFIGKEGREECGRKVGDLKRYYPDIIQEAMMKKKIKKRRRKIGFKDW